MVADAISSILGNTTALIFLAVGLVALFTNWLKLGKSTGRVVGVAGIALALVTAGVFNLGSLPFAAGTSTAKTTTTTSETMTASACSDELGAQTVSWDVSALDKGQPGTTLTETVRLKYNGADLGTFSGGTAQTLAVAGDYEALVTATGYYGSKISGKTPCTRQFTGQPVNGRHAGLDFVRRTPDGRLVITEQNYSVGSGQTATYSILARGNRTKSYWSNPDLDYEYVLLNLNTTAIDTAVDESFVKSAENVPVPSGQVGTYESAWKLAGTKTYFDFGERTVEIVVNADDSVDPQASAVANTAGSDVVGVLFMDADYFVHTIKGLDLPVQDGVENNAGTDIGGTNYLTTLTYT